MLSACPGEFQLQRLESLVVMAVAIVLLEDQDASADLDESQPPVTQLLE